MYCNQLVPILGATETTIGPGINAFLNIYEYKILSTIGATLQATTETTAETSESTEQGINVSMYYLRFDCSGNWIPFATALASSFVITVLLIVLALLLVLRRRKRQKVKHIYSLILNTKNWKIVQITKFKCMVSYVLESNDTH